MRRVGLRTLIVITTLMAFALGATPAAWAETADLPPGGTFRDDDSTPAEGYIEAIAAIGVTRGCNPPYNTRFCPDRPLTRGEMATFFVRALELPAVAGHSFGDADASVHVSSIGAIAAAGLTKGCNPPDNDRFCPGRTITRGEMAAFLVRAFGYADGAGTDAFSDDDGSVFESDINRLASAGITSGCAEGRFCPQAALTRGAMAVLLGRALGLTPLVPPERPPPPYPDVGDGKRIIYSNSEQRVWMIDENAQLVDTYLVSGRKGVPSPGTYSVYSKSPTAWAGHHGITMKWMVRFAHGARLAIGFHSIPRYSNGTPMQTESDLGRYRSSGCVRQADAKAKALYDWAPVGTTVIVLP